MACFWAQNSYCSGEQTSVLQGCSNLWSGVASVTQPRQLGTTNILMHALKSGLFRVVMLSTAAVPLREKLIRKRSILPCCVYRFSISVIGISAKSHISATLCTISMLYSEELQYSYISVVCTNPHWIKFLLMISKAQCESGYMHGTGTCRLAGSSYICAHSCIYF